jgi:zinc protease
MSAATARHAGAAPRSFLLEGGTVVFLESSHDVPLVSFVVALRCGSSTDPEGKSGVSRIAMRMLRRGVEALTSEQIDFRIDALGAELAVDTSHSTVAIHAQVIARNLEPFIDLLSRMLSTPTFPEDELARLKRESVAEIIEGRDNDRVVAQKAMQRTLYKGHSYGRSSGGTTESVPKITRDDVLAFYRRYVVRQNIVIGIAGDVKADRAPGIAARLMAGLAEGERAVDPTPDPTMAPGRRLLFVDKPERTQTQILIGTMGTSPHDEDHVPLVVGNAVFGGTFTSRLMKEIRSKRGWSYGASARAGIDRKRQSWVLWTFPAAEDCAPCLKLSIELTETWVRGGVTPREVAFIQRYLVRSHAFEIDTATKRLHQGLDIEGLSLPADYFSAWLDHVRKVTPEAATEAVKNRIRPEDMLVVVLGTASQVLDPVRAAMPDLAESTVVPFDLE